MREVSGIDPGLNYKTQPNLRTPQAKFDVTALYLETGSDKGVCPHCGRSAPAKRPRLPPVFDPLSGRLYS